MKNVSVIYQISTDLEAPVLPDQNHDHSPDAASHQARPGHDTADSVTDPVCGMQVNPATSAHQFSHGDQIFHFCSARCREKFAAEPGRYLKAEAIAPPPARLGAVYTCPMHPEIRQEGPGSCPICGMALEPLDVTAETGPSPELRDMSRRFWIGLVLSLPVITLEMGAHLPVLNLHHWVGPGRRYGRSSCWPPQWCCGLAGHSSCEAGPRW